MHCLHCNREAPDASTFCPDCGGRLTSSRREPAARLTTHLPSANEITRSAADPEATGLGGAERRPEIGARRLHAGDTLGLRYRIIQTLGVGGMGVVYQAWDEELGVAIALKVIRPEVMADPVSARVIEERFKRELLLARQVTHRNVVRIHDFGEIEEIKYITMPFIQGEDLATVLRREGRLPLPRALSLARQIAAGLAAAHDAGVVHRDLKPANIMVDREGQALVMDFGIARSTAVATTAGGVVGTLDYMAPEQTSGAPVKEPADVYALGLILTEMLVGRRRSADASLSAVIARGKEKAVSLRSLDPNVPDALDRIVVRCGEPSPEARFQNARELLTALERLDENGHAILDVANRRRVWPQAPAVATLLLLLVGAGWWFGRPQSVSAPVTAPNPTTVLIADFDNRTNDPVFDGVIEQSLGLALEGASFISAFSRRDALQAAARLQPGKRLDESTARLIAIREGVDVVVPGSIAARGGGYDLTVRVLDAAAGRELLTATARAGGKEEVFAVVGRLAAQVRETLGDVTPESAQLSAAETFSAGSLDAAHSYAEGQEALWAGKPQQAIESYRRAVALDPEMGRAYAGLATAYGNLGSREQAEKYYQLSLERLDRMSDREKYRTRSLYYLYIRNLDKAIEDLNSLVKLYPSDSAALANLAVFYSYKRDMAQALKVGRQSVATAPNNVIRRNNVALYAMYAGDFDTAAREAEVVLKLQPFPKAFVALALSRLAQGRVSEAAEAYARLKAVVPGSSFATAGLADLAFFEGRLGDAAADLESAIAADLQDGNPGAAARNLVTLAEVRLARGDASGAITTAGRALAQVTNDTVSALAGEVFIRAGAARRGAAIAETLGRRLEPEAQVSGFLLQAEGALVRGDTRAAVTLAQEAQKILDTWRGRLTLGRAYLQAGAFTEAHSEFETCLKRRGEATAVFLDEIPTFHLLPSVYYYLGLAQQGLKSPAASETFRTFLSIKTKGEPDRLIADAQRRLEAR